MTYPVRTRHKSKRLWGGLTHQQAADAAGVSRAIIQQWESMTHEPHATEAIKVAKAMDLDFEDLFHDFEMQRVDPETPLQREAPRRGRPRREETAIA